MTRDTFWCSVKIVAVPVAPHRQPTRKYLVVKINDHDKRSRLDFLRCRRHARGRDLTMEIA